MNLPRFVTLAFLLALFPRSFCSIPRIAPAMPPTELSVAWQNFSIAQTSGAPQSAIEALSVISEGCRKNGNYANALWAIILKARIEAQREDRENADAHVIRTLTPVLSKIGAAEGLPLSMRPYLEAALAKAWWGYYQQNRWQLLRRTQTVALPSDDFTAWDARSVLAETARHFDAAFMEPEALQSTPIGALNNLVAGGFLPEAYRPTAFDFLAFQAIDFFSVGEQGIAQAETHFEPDPDSPLLGTLDEFLGWQPSNATGESASPALRAIQLYQAVLRFHRKDPAPHLALADADLQRITWAAKITNCTGKPRHIAALNAFVERNLANPLSATACATLAQLLEESDPTAAHAAATRGLSLQPSANVAVICSNIQERIEEPSIKDIATDSTWTEPWPEIAITYRNRDKVYFRVIPLDWAGELNDDYKTLSDRLNALLEKSPAKTWSVVLPPTADNRYRTEKIPAPRDLKPGYYCIIASTDGQFSPIQTSQVQISPNQIARNQMASTTFWVSNLTFVLDDGAHDMISGCLVDATTGEPVANANIAVWRGNDRGRFSFFEKAKTNKAGAFSFSVAAWRDCHLHATTWNDGVAIATPYAIHARVPPRPQRADDGLFFFTDRAIYRPGQTVQFKAVALRADTHNEKYQILPNRKFTVSLRDPNSKEVAQLTLTTNGFGSLSGSFTIPAGRLTGVYRMHVKNFDVFGSEIRVEEYKRPKFETSLAAPDAASRLDSEVEVSGFATAYTGAHIDNAKVSWRVRRLTRWPSWCWWAQPGPARAIAHGVTTTDASGKFTLRFVAAADKTVDPSDEPVFNYEITAEVTDATGETRAATRTVSIGYAALTATVAAAGWLTTGKPVTLRLTTKSPDGAPRAAQGVVTIHPLKQPATVIQPALARNSRHYYVGFVENIIFIGRRPEPTTNSPDTRDWPEDDAISTIPFSTDDTTGLAEITANLPAGIYRAVVRTADRFGKIVTATTDLRVRNPDARRHDIREPFALAAESWEMQPGETFIALWGSGYDSARALISFERKGRVLKRFWTKPGVTQQRISLPITEDMRGGITLHVCQVRDNRLVTRTQNISIPWNSKQLEITWEHFNSKLTPGGRETWTARITGPDGKCAAAEFAAALCDVSLDQFKPHSWDDLTSIYDTGQTWYHGSHKWNMTSTPLTMRWEVDFRRIARIEPTPQKQLYPDWGDQFHAQQNQQGGPVLVTYGNALADDGVVMLEAFSASRSRRSMRGIFAKALSRPTPEFALSESSRELAMPPPPSQQEESSSLALDLSTITARKNLSETAFFFPQLRTAPDGSVRMEFTVPETLTRWKFLCFAHDKQLRSAVLTNTAVTAKDLMVQPNPPRFLREGDTVEFTVKITNMTDRPQQGSARIEFTDAATLNPVNLTSGGTTAVSSASSSKDSTAAVPPENPRAFTLAPNSSQTLSWRITVPDGQGFLTYKAVAATDSMSDGEEGFLPVLSRRQLVTESIALPIRDKGTRTFTFEKLAASATDTTLRSESLTVQMTSNPAWYAVLALPSLMEFPHECAEQLFNRYYANALAAHIANSDPKIACVFEQWHSGSSGTGDSPMGSGGMADSAMLSEHGRVARATHPTQSPLDSPLLQNEDLKSILIEETPWLRAATRESEQRRAIAQLFDLNRTTSQTDSILKTLAERQGSDGLWAWFPGGRGSEYITRYIVAGFARLRHFGIKLDNRADAMLKRAVTALDAALVKYHDYLTRENLLDRETIISAYVYQLYTRSFFLKEIPIPADARAAYDYFAGQTRKHWLKLPLQSQGHAALALARMGEAGGADTAAAIVTSLKQRAKNSEELGMYWPGVERGWFWWQAPIETHALMIEVFDEVARDTQAVADLQLWLLKQRQTQSWPSTKATADAVYALLLRGTDKLASDALVSVSLGGSGIPRSGDPRSEPGTGYYSRRIPGGEVTPAMGEKITVTKTDAGPAWGSVTWQYFQDIDKITPHEGTPLTLKKTIWKQINTAAGPSLVPIAFAAGNPGLQALNSKLNPGDTLVVRIELRTDRDMEFVHLKDQRGSGTEPVNVLSGYRWKNGLGCYESTRDTATHFFIDWLPAGTHVFEYQIRVQLRGRYESGIAEIQCMYAPEFNSHSASTTLVVE